MEYCGLQEEIEDEKETKEFRGASEYIFHGKFNMEEQQQFNVRFNCTSSCLVPLIGPKAKLLICFATYVNNVFVREYKHHITVKANLKKVYDDHMAALEDEDSEEEERERNKKRRRTSRY